MCVFCICQVRKGNGRYAFLCESTVALTAVNAKPCDLEIVKARGSICSYGLAVREDFPMRNQFHKAMLQVICQEGAAVFERF